MVDHSTANLDGADPPPSRVIGDGSDVPLQRQVLPTGVLYGDGSDGPSRT